jgi:beta-N-acetylhexosaminidase
MSPSGIRRAIGQLVTVGIAGHAVPVELRALAKEFDLGGVILFARNVADPEQVAELAFGIRTLVADLPLWVAIDQEGGRVARLRAPLTVWPAMRALGHSGDAQLAARVAGAMARELRSLGVTFNCAPVLDVLTTADNPAIGDRAIAGEAATVATLGAAMIRAMQDEGVAACGKHFPGHGDTNVDSHHDLPVVEHGPDRLRALEYVPFRAAIEAGVTGILVSHLLLPAFDERHPATLSRRIVTGELREALGFDGLVVTDDLYMKGCAARVAPPAAAVQAVAAGHDMVLLCEPKPDDHAEALEGLVHAVEDGTLSFAQVERSIARQKAAKARYLDDPEAARRPTSRWREVIGCDAHQRIAAELSAHA